MTYLRREAYRRLQRIFGFAPWHVDPYDYRPYAKWMVEKLSRMLEDGRCGDGEIVEIGCGLGDIISNIRSAKRKTGYDLDPHVIRAARLVHPKTKFHVGTFTQVRGRKIAIAIACNFMHDIPSEQVQEYLTDFLTDNDVALFVVDRVPAPPYDYSHDYDDMLAPLQYHRIYTSRGFDAMGARRHVWLYAKGDCR